ENTLPQLNLPAIILEGTVVGVVTGIVGAGGGFLIIPALVLFAKLPMKKAVGTSLLIIAAKSLIGFIGDVQRYGDQLDWTRLLTVTAIAVFGIFIGIYLNTFIDGKKLKKGFGWFVLLMAVYIIGKQL
ncbi:MAG: sulfite exporter TauE/SafE family protein, partial [Schleiferiaceae bacterium]|nr:sulfite exporter TauE/SafE family protein [Schleiferiaceae bacterium]